MSSRVFDAPQPSAGQRLPSAEPGETVSESGRTFRGDIDGLRAVAIILVVAFHAGVPGLGGGFIGVDVFFVISGYLITTNLLAESEARGRVGLLGFWANRIRRLVPAMALMLVAVFVLAMLILPSLDWETVAVEGRAASLYVSNLYYAQQATDYFAADIGNSLFLHTWSLGVEEQFYILWPLLFVAGSLVTRRRATALRGVLVAAFIATLVASLGLSLVLTDQGSPWAFFGLPSRAWEFAVAGLLAAAPAPRLLRDRTAQAVTAIVGLVLIGAAAVTLSDTSPYPGYRALLPVIGTVLVIRAGTASPDRLNLVSATLATRPTQWVGRVSYSWYLWHWPLILLAVAALDDDRLPVTIGAATASLAVAAVAHFGIENPLRFATALTGSKASTYALGAGITVAVLLASVGVAAYADDQIVGNDLYAELDQVQRSRRSFDCPRETTTPNGIAYCEAGDSDSEDTIVLAGDSHARHWTPAFIAAAEEEGFHLAIRWRGACLSTNLPTLSPTPIQPGVAVDPDCTTYQSDTDALIEELDADVVVLSNSTGYVLAPDEPLRGPEAKEQFWQAGFRSRVESLQDDGRAVVLVVDTPRLLEDPIDCMAEAGGTEPCRVPRTEAFDPTRLAREHLELAVVSELGDVPTLDINDAICPDGTCEMRVDGELVYTDIEHLYSGFVLTLTPQVVNLVDDAIALSERGD